ncbi:SDR family oxidoreductase [Pseudonocardia sp. MH-G8]|uniref:SDR family oxidoreductase n=1 Tax=Pseudonocardia sp. MH-G8 TaxID=1854588 RepID=UPI000BA16CAF|nr:SDR family NAD(P)-dependent oxidoreductase [Pseudonocardia sp. MH-G8]OZM76473.1 short-chain dehydrogenase [Pseudonocardia sp. MH-G8]
MDDEHVVWVTGGGTGMGAAVARSAAARGWAVAVSGRRPEPLDDVAGGIARDGGRALALPVDVQDPAAVAAARQAVLDTFGRLDAVVLSAGRNSRQRSWSDQDMDVFDDIVRTNLTAAARVVDAALPDLRATGGKIVMISSVAGWRFSPGAGVAYSASKTALGSLTKSINDQEAEHGVRACHLCPGDVATDFLEQRPSVPDAAARAVMLTPEDIAAAVQYVLDTPAHVRVDELVVSPISQR